MTLPPRADHWLICRRWHCDLSLASHVCGILQAVCLFFLSLALFVMKLVGHFALQLQDKFKLSQYMKHTTLLYVENWITISPFVNYDESMFLLVGFITVPLEKLDWHLTYRVEFCCLPFLSLSVLIYCYRFVYTFWKLWVERLRYFGVVLFCHTLSLFFTQVQKTFLYLINIAYKK